MSAAAERLALAQVGQSLVALGGDRGERRARALVQGASPAHPASFSDLAGAPGWLLQSREAIARLAVAAALVAMAPALAASIDGRWLRDLAERAGEETLDHAMSLAGAVPGSGLPAIAAAEMEATGFDLLRAALPETLHRYITWAPPRGTTPPAPLARFSIDAADAFLRGRRP